MEKKRKKKGESKWEKIGWNEDKKICPFDAKKVCPVTCRVKLIALPNTRQGDFYIAINLLI